MKAIRINAPGEVEIIDIEKPVRKPGEALLKLLYGGICGSDLGSYRGTFVYFDYPRIPGHEFSAEIVEIDDNDKGLKPGMIVTCNPYFNCGGCYSCNKGTVNACMSNETMGCQRDGAFGEYITMPIERIYDGKGINPKFLAAIEPFCISYHGVQRAGINPGEKVLVVGAGTIGVFAALAAKTLGAEVYITDVAEKKVQYAQDNFSFAGTIVNDSPDALIEATKKITGVGPDGSPNGFDVCIEAVGLPSTFQNCIDMACYGGRVVLIGVGKQNLDFNFTMLQKKELNVYGSRNALKKDFLELIDWVSQNKVDISKVITNEYAFEDAATAFKDFSEKGADMLKVVLNFNK